MNCPFCFVCYNEGKKEGSTFRNNSLLSIIFLSMRIFSRHLGAFALVVFGVAVIGLGVLQVGTYLKEPYESKETPRNQNEISAQILAANEVQDLNLLDTDKDGLSDFDELNLYKTSPYLADSDSDGISDKVEIDALEDPNCPKGYVCDEVIEGGEFPQAVARPSVQETPSAPAEQIDVSALKSGAGDAEEGAETAENIASQDQDEEASSTQDFRTEQIAEPQVAPRLSSLSATEIGTLAISEMRNLLLERGVEKSVLDNFSDDELKLLLEEVVSEESAGDQNAGDNLNNQ